MTKTIYTTFLFLFLSIFGKAQYGPQDSVNILGYTCLLHLPDTYSTEGSVKHPLIIMFQGAGEIGPLAKNATVHGTGYALKKGTWDGNAINPTTGLLEKFIVLSTLSNSSSGPISWQDRDAIYSYMIAHYRVDTTCMGITGLSRGGGASWYYSDGIINISGWPPVYQRGVPSHRLAADIFMSPESNTYDDAIQMAKDSVWCWGFGDTRDPHGWAGKSNIDSVNARLSGYGRFTSYTCNSNPCPGNSCGHCGWDPFYDSSYKETIDGKPMSIYQFQLYKRRTTTVTPPSNSINTGSIATSYCITKSVGASVTIPFTSIGVYNSGNVYTAQLSDKTGSFTSPVNIGTLASTGNSGNISATIPAGTPFGTKYLIRIVSSNPSVISNDNGSNITITLADNSITPVSPQTLQVNASGFPLTVSEPSAPISRIWYYGTASGGPYSTNTGMSAITYTPSFSAAGTYYVVCKSVFTCGTITSNEVQFTVSVASSSHRIYVTQNPGSCSVTWYTGSPGDTLVFRASLNDYCRIELHGINGTQANPITVTNEGGPIRNSGSFVLFDCHFINENWNAEPGLPHVSGTISAGQFGGASYDFPYGYESYGVNGSGGAGLEIRGKDSNITINNVYIHDKGKFGTSAGYGIIIKNDPLDYGCDTTYDYPNTFKNITIWNVYEENIQQDANYLGFSGGYNGPGGQCFVCNGKTVCPRPPALGNIEMYNIYMKNIARTGIHAAQLAGGNCKFHDIHGYNLGWEVTGTQGALIDVGTPDSSVEIYNCTANLTYKPAVYTYNYGLFYLHDNKFDSSGYVRDTNNVIQTYNGSNVEVYPQNNTFNSPTQFIIKNNQLGVHKNIAGNIGLYTGPTNNYSDTGNVICNSGAVYHYAVDATWSDCQVANTVSTSTLSGSPFCVKAASTASGSLSGTSIGTFTSGNTYTGQLSDANGSFAAAVNVGSISSTANSFTIPITIPANTPTGSGYRLRIVSSAPAVTSAGTSTFEIDLAANSISPVASQNIYTGIAGTPLTVTESATPLSRMWYYGATSTGVTTSTYTPLFNTAGTYVVTCQSVYSCGTITSNSVTIVVTDAPPPPPDSVKTGTISPLSYCITSSLGASISVPFTNTRVAGTGNVYTAQLSAINGNFASHIDIGTLSSTASSGTVSGTIPANTTPGTKYRVRVVSSNPTEIFVKNTQNITVKLASNSISPSGAQNIYTSQYGATVNVTESYTPNSRMWWWGTTSGTYTTSTGDDSVNYTPIFQTAGTYYVVCKSTYDCATVTSNEIIITVTDAPPPPPDTICTTTSIIHDTIVSKTFSRIVQVPTVKDTTICKTFKFFWFVISLGCTTYHDTTTYHDSTEYYDSAVHQNTPPHDTTICVITGMNESSPINNNYPIFAFNNKGDIIDNKCAFFALYSNRHQRRSNLV